MFLHGIGCYRLNALRRHLLEKGIIPKYLYNNYIINVLFTLKCTFPNRDHGNCHRQPSHSLSAEDMQYVVNFLFTYGEDNAILLPGRVPGYKDSDRQLLPSSTTKRAVWQKYLEALSTTNLREVKYSTFTMIWRKYCPSLTVMKPMTDLCKLCQRNSTVILRAANKPEAEKAKV